MSTMKNLLPFYLSILQLCLSNVCFPEAFQSVSAPLSYRQKMARVCYPSTSSVSFRQITHLGIAPQQLGSFEVLDLPDSAASERRVALLDYATTNHSPIPFETAWTLQKKIVEEQIRRLSEDPPQNPFLQEGNDMETVGRDHVILLQHAPVYTLGTGSDEKFVLSDNQSVPVVRMDRGGEVTYHGPGQITIYPILDLRSYKQDIHWYMRALEEVVLMALSKCGLSRAERQSDITGIWVDNFKVAAVGIKCRKWVSLHGIAVNVEESSLANFDGIVPCGLEGRKVGCINQFVDKPLSVAEFAEYVKEAMEEVFNIKLISAKQNMVQL